MVDRYVAAVDQGTTSTRCILFDHAGRLAAVAQREHRQHLPRPGWVEHDAQEILRNVLRVVGEAVQDVGAGPGQVVALGIANQRETTVLWDPRTGQPYGHAVVWQDLRTEARVEELAADGGRDRFRDVCGLPLTTYFAGPRIAWLLDATPGLRDAAAAGHVLFGTVDSWLVWNLTGGPDGGVHVTDVTNASRTMLMDLAGRHWSPALCEAMGVPMQILPEIRSSAEVYGLTGGPVAEVLPGVPVAAALGDQQAALFGQTCFAPGEAKCTYGTGSFVLINTGATPVTAEHGTLPTVAYQIGDEPAAYALEGAIAVTGSLVQWFRDGLGMIATAPDIEGLALSVPDNGGCYIVPAFSGLFAPHWRPDARGVVVGLTSFVTRAHLARAVLEATAWQTRDVVDAMDADSGLRLTSLRVDGGMTSNNLLMQTVADVLGVPVVRPMVSETVSLGAAYAAGLAVGWWPDLEGLRRNWHRAGEWLPHADPAAVARGHEDWTRAVQHSFGWSREPSSHDGGAPSAQPGR
ncbi:glycerol kinase GlpK [Jannaschia sp. R86511]|uniref:glycerol kinase GlpK n=1 Tax=Jannaschia sp. R86511 TaxID=3093853 RepID=UPI0036D2A0F3